MSLGKITKWKSPGILISGKGWGPRKSQHSLYRKCVLCSSDCNIYFEQPILCPECWCKQQSSWDRLWLAERKKKILFFFLCPISWQSSIQDWGEEVEEGAVYHVTLKRVQIQQAANKGARWLGVSKAGEIVNFGLAVSLVL